MSFTYKGTKTREISFPLGGIGSGCIGLGGDGRLKDWEIFNRPNKGSVNGLSHFAIKAERNDATIDARVLHGDLAVPYVGELTGKEKTGFGYGPRRENLAGVPHFRETEFVGEFPFALIRYIDDSFPGRVELEAFNPFIPLDDRNSSIPAAFFEIRVTNTTDDVIDYTVAGTICNPAEADNSRHDLARSDDSTIITLASPKTAIGHPSYGGLSIGSDSGLESDVSFQQYWYRGRWFDGLGVYWRDFVKPGRFVNRKYDHENTTDVQDTATLARHVRLRPGAEGRLRFVIAWHYPNCYNYWSGDSCGCDPKAECDSTVQTWRNYYATVFRDATEVASYALSRWTELYARTKAFKDTLFASSLPAEVIDAISANISILKTPTTLRLTDGSFYGFEGCDQQEGCCEGSCTHVWNYAYALPYLFPKLERSMRDLEFNHNLREDGKLEFRLMLPVGSPKWGFRACVDGQYGAVLKTYREWKISGNNEWLSNVWPGVKRAIEFAWAESNEDQWDPGKRGVIDGRQHHTLDMELFGANSWLNSLYLAGLKAGAIMADQIGDDDAATLYRDIFTRGKLWTDRELFNGEYYHQKVDLNDRAILEAHRHPGDTVLKGGDILDAYWDEEHGEIKYQIAEGSAIDQVLGQWHANLLGLGEVLDREQTRTALSSIFRYNHKTSMRHTFNPCRTFCLNDEAGTVICEWPEGTYKPYVPVVYAEETMHGFEYQVACHMIQEGLVEEGLQLVRAVRDRYDGERRNPWNEIECGSNYARSMASYALLLTFSGFDCNMSTGELRFNPIFHDGSAFSSFWSVESAWGAFHVSDEAVSLGVNEGKVTVNRIALPFLEHKPRGVSIAEESPTFTWADGVVTFSRPVEIQAGVQLRVAR